MMGVVRPPVQEVFRETTVEFADREKESQALAASLVFMSDVLRDRRDIDAFCHVLTFYGGSGVGKSSLSKRLQAWLQGELADDHWGHAPDVPNVRCVRWDLESSQGEIDAISMLMSFRAALPRIPGGWKFMDMALLSLVQSARPGEDLRLRVGKTENGQVLAEAFQALVDDVGGVFDITTGIASQSVKVLVALARRVYQDQQLKRYPELGRLIDDCNAQEASASPSPELAARVLQIADEQISMIANPEDRPLMVIFVDTFEKLQSNDRRNGEAAINHLVAALPQSLFVISGRNRLDWDNPARILLAYRGPRTWPHLGHGVLDNPRQHRVGMLSEHDTRQVFRRRAVQEGFGLDDDALDRVVERTGGWPVHIDAICRLGAGLSAGTGSYVSAQELDRPFPDVVRRVLENLTDAQARAFRGACLLPYFDDALVAATAGVDEGEARAMRARAMVELHEDPQWKYQVHDAVRGVIRGCDPESVGGWAEADWKTAAQRAIDHVEGCFRKAIAASDDVGTVKTAALAIRIAVENDMWAEWFVQDAPPSPDAPRSAHAAAPAEALSPLLPTKATHPEASAMLRYYAARRNRNVIESVEMLAELANGDTKIARHAALWVAYKQRAAGNFDEAIEALRGLIDKCPWWRIPVGQVGITMAEGRRFNEALSYAENVDSYSQRYIRDNVCMALGLLTDGRILPWDRRETSSARYAIEMLGARRRWEARTTGVDLGDVNSTLSRATNAGHLGAQRNCHYARACVRLAHDELVAGDVKELEILDSSGVRPSFHLAEVLALRALLTGRQDEAQRAYELWKAAPVRPSSWLPVETYLMELGQPVIPDPTQWPEPEEAIRRRWRDIAAGIIDRANRIA